jgi:hypothetical protein
MLKLETFISNQQFINALSYLARAYPQGEIVNWNLQLIHQRSRPKNLFLKSTILVLFILLVCSNARQGLLRTSI